jgi:hypothetical protein
MSSGETNPPEFIPEGCLIIVVIFQEAVVHAEKLFFVFEHLLFARKFISGVDGDAVIIISRIVFMLVILKSIIYY